MESDFPQNRNPSKSPGLLAKYRAREVGAQISGTSEFAYIQRLEHESLASRSVLVCASYTVMASADHAICSRRIKTVFFDRHIRFHVIVKC